MNAGTRNEIETIFFAAIDKRTQAEKKQFLDAACGNNVQLRQEVEALLAAHQAPETFLAYPIADIAPTANSPVEECEGSKIGPHKLLQKLGEGGFGLVYMAEQTSPLRRRVALKIIKPGMDSKEVVARFEAERQALAMMDHPNIATVLDGGTTATGRPYFVMELVKGASITEFCDTNRLNTLQRLGLFRQVCQAVQHAHQKGVIHRDLKPNNVMVTLHDGVPVPKVIDFGVAKALSQPLTEKTLFTRYGQIVGTPQYMSPEQAELSGLDVDTRSDVYSLGVLLYELLTGKPPFDAHQLRQAGFDGMRRIIREQEPLKPSTAISTLQDQEATLIASRRSQPPKTLRRSIVGDLDWIAIKCLEKDRKRRYETTNELIRDIDRHFADEPIQAGPPTLYYQCRKLYQRHRVAVSTAAAIAATVLLGFATTTIAWAQESRQREIADQQRLLAQHKAEQLHLATAEAEQAATRAQSTLDVLKSLLTTASPDPQKGTEVTVSQLLESFAEQLDTINLKYPRAEIELRLTLGKAFARFSMLSSRREQYQRAEQIARASLPPKSLELAAFLMEVASAGSKMAVVPYLEEALTYLNESPKANLPEGRLLEIRLRWLLGLNLEWDKPVLSEQHYRRACRLTRELDHAEKATLQINPFLQLAENLYEELNDFDAARKLAQEANDFAAEFGDAGDQIAALLFARRFESDQQADQYLQKARRLALDGNDGRAILSVLAAEVASLTDKRHHPDFPDRVQRMAADAMSHWQLLHSRKLRTIGRIWGMLLELDKNELADQLEALIVKLPARRREGCARTAGHRLLWAGRLNDAVEMYNRSSPHDPWYAVQRARCRSKVRDFDRTAQWLHKGIEVSPKSGTTTRLWIRLELATVFEAAGKMEQAKETYAALIPELVEAQETDTHSAGMLVLCLGKSARWDMVDSDTLDKMETHLKKMNNRKERSVIQALYCSALALLAKHRNNPTEYIEYLIAANRHRPGAPEQLQCEWIPAALVKELTVAGRTKDLEELLREDVQHRDSVLAHRHPERAHTRIRLAEMLLREQRSKEQILPLLKEAKKVHKYHGDWIPAREQEHLNKLLEQAAG